MKNKEAIKNFIDGKKIIDIAVDYSSTTSSVENMIRRELQERNKKSIFQITNGKDGDVEIKIKDTICISEIEFTLSEYEFVKFCEEIDRVRGLNE